MMNFFKIFLIIFMFLISFSASKDNQNLIYHDFLSVKISVETQIKGSEFFNKDSSIVEANNHDVIIKNKRNNSLNFYDLSFHNFGFNNFSPEIFNYIYNNKYFHNHFSSFLKNVICTRAP